MKHNLKSIMHNAWRLVKKLAITISEALRIAWSNAKAKRIVKATAGIIEETHTWAGWKALGYEVQHGSVALYKVTTTDPTTKTGKRTTSYFGQSQVKPITE